MFVDGYMLLVDTFQPISDILRVIEFLLVYYLGTIFGAYVCTPPLLADTRYTLTLVHSRCCGVVFIVMVTVFVIENNNTFATAHI